jgi:hypothetical protein
MPIEEPITNGNVEVAVIVVVTLVVIWMLRQSWNAIWGRRSQAATLGREAAYADLAQQAKTALEQVSSEQRKIAAGMEELRTRMAAIEAMLREVG